MLTFIRVHFIDLILVKYITVLVYFFVGVVRF